MAAPAIGVVIPERREAHPHARRAELNLNWYALRTRSNFEFQVSAVLAEGFGAFLPFYTKRYREHGADILRRRPLFPGYVFVCADIARDRLFLLAPRGVAGIIGGRRPEPVPAADIENLRIAAAAPEALIAPAAPHEGELVTVARGPLAGLTGVMERAKSGAALGRRLIVRIEFLNRACALEISQAEVYRAARSAA